MIAPEVIGEIERLLECGQLSNRGIAAQVGVSRGTVNAVANGQYARRRKESQRPDDFDFPHGPPRRCPACGRLVQMPCLACRVQKLALRRAETAAVFRQLRWP